MLFRFIAPSIFVSLLLAAAAVGAAAPETQVVSRAVPETAGTSYSASEPSVSADGRFVAFSHGPILGRLGGNRVYVLDRLRDAAVLASRTTGGQAGDAVGPEIASGGGAVTFTTSSRVFVPRNRRAVFHVAVRDLARRSTVIADRASGRRGPIANRSAIAWGISGNGRRVAFTSNATNLGVPATKKERAYVRDLRTHRTILVSRATGRTGRPGNGDVAQVAMSDDGRVVAFSSTAINLHSSDRDASRSVYVRDLRTNRTVLVSRATGVRGSPGTGRADWPAVSPDGRYVAFTYRGGKRGLDPSDPDPVADIYVRDLARDTTILVSRASGGAKSNGTCERPSLSRHARAIAFVCAARNLDPDDPDGRFDVFFRNLRTGTTELVSRASGGDGAPAEDPDGPFGRSQFNADGVSLSGDGRIVGFDTADNLDPRDADDDEDAYVRVLR